MRLQELFMLEGSRLDIHHYIDDIEKVLFFGESLKKNRTIKLKYQKFDCSPPRTIMIEPYWLKDYEDRIYLVGHPISCSNRKKVITLALDRILDQ